MLRLNSPTNSDRNLASLAGDAVIAVIQFQCLDDRAIPYCTLARTGRNEIIKRCKNALKISNFSFDLVSFGNRLLADIGGSGIRFGPKL